ncbi:hypothetical protein ACO0J9_13040 [Pseudomonas aeruginosa]|uniref:hypothetical protein n=1 Tax=Pseudomonas aeruginosa TaxID=287 RepID=UPI0021DA3FA2|nr:hypothetical protein [Pseudomonas aeruginosa]MCU9268991.1 hypothetical protein [Pseudomonas aeruginosa]
MIQILSLLVALGAVAVMVIAWRATRAARLVAKGEGALPPSPLQQLQPKQRRSLFLALGLLAVFLMPLVLIQPAEAALSDTMRGIFDGALATFVNGIMQDTNNDIYTWSWMMFLALAFLLLFIELVKFIFEGFNAVSHLEALCYLFITMGLMAGYNAFTEAIWGVGVGLSNGYQQYLVGNTDNFFLSQWIHKATGAVVLDDLDLFDSIRLILYTVQWTVICALLDVVFWLAAMWAEFGYALAKITGLIFVPFLLLPMTRPLFDGWFKFFCGFVFLLIILKATMVVAAITIKAILESLGVSFSGDYGDPAQVVQIAKENMYLLLDASAMLLIAILFILSSFAFASMIAGGVGNLSGGLGKATNMAIRKFLK